MRGTDNAMLVRQQTDYSHIKDSKVRLRADLKAVITIFGLNFTVAKTPVICWQGVLRCHFKNVLLPGYRIRRAPKWSRKPVLITSNLDVSRSVVIAPRRAFAQKAKARGGNH